MYLEPVKLSDETVEFLCFWYADPFGYCNIPHIVVNQKKLKTKEGKRRHKCLDKKLKKFVLV